MRRRTRWGLPGSGHQFDQAGLPAFEVLERRLVVMMFKPGTAWDIEPFTQLTLRIVEHGRSSGAGAPVTRSR